MEIYGVLQTLVNVDVNDLTEHLHKAYDAVLPVSIWDNYNGITCALRRQFPCKKRHLYYIHNNPPPGRVRVFLCPRRYKIEFQVLRSHPLWAPGPIWMSAPQGPFNFLLRQDPILHVNWIYHYRCGVIDFIIIDIILSIIGITILLKDIHMSLCIMKLE